MTRIRVNRLNGEVLEVILTEKEANHLACNRDLKQCLAKADASIPGTSFYICWVRLMDMEGLEIQNEDELNWDHLEQGSLQYVLVDVMSFALDQLPPSDDLIFFYKDLDQLLEPKTLIAYAAKICKQKGQAFCEHVFGAWASAFRSLSSDESNSYEKPFGFTLLNRCMVLLQGLEQTQDIVRDLIRAEHPNADHRFWRDIFHDGHWPGDPFEDFLHETFASATIELVKHKLLPETVEESFPFSGDALKQDLWKLVRSSCRGGLRFGLGADLMMALIDKGLPHWCWGGCLGPLNRTLLQYIIEPTNVWLMDVLGEAEARLCIFLAERLSLEELCHQNQGGRNALSSAGDVAYFADAHGGLWIQVRDAISEQMEAKVREFQGSLHQLVELTESVQAGLGGLADSLDSLPAFEEQMWQQAAVIRQQWLRMGWHFTYWTANQQIAEVLNWHFQQVGQGMC